jgi:phenylacetate-CoA ligase
VQQIREYQDARFAEVLDRCFDAVPYYRRTFGELGITRADLSGLADLARLPLLAKDVVRRHGPELVSLGATSYWVQHTSGSTGTPLDVHLNRWTYQLVHGLLADYERHSGISRQDLRATFAGRLTQPVDRMTPPFWRYNHAERQLLFSAYHLNDETLPLYLGELRRRRPSEIIGYPSAISTLAEYAVRKGLVGDVRPRVVITNSETLLAWQREVIEEAFRCPVRDYYGSAEAVVFAEQCAHQTYHVNPLLGVAEVVDQSGAPAPEGQLVCTTLTNTVMPLIRYEIGTPQPSRANRAPAEARGPPSHRSWGAPMT